MGAEVEEGAEEEGREKKDLAECGGEVPDLVGLEQSIDLPKLVQELGEARKNVGGGRLLRSQDGGDEGLGVRGRSQEDGLRGRQGRRARVLIAMDEDDLVGRLVPGGGGRVAVGAGGIIVVDVLFLLFDPRTRSFPSRFQYCGLELVKRVGAFVLVDANVSDCVVLKDCVRLLSTIHNLGGGRGGRSVRKTKQEERCCVSVHILLTRGRFKRCAQRSVV